MPSYLIKYLNTSLTNFDLPLFLLVLTLHSTFSLFSPTIFHTTASYTLLCLNLTLTIPIIIWFLKFHNYTILHVFNREVPPLFSYAYFLSLSHYLLLARPFPSMFRKLTASWRILPHVLIIGEVRCGTTTLSQHLSQFPGCSTPFVPWHHPELKDKESFFFVGHFNGIVDPDFYSLCFPLKITEWFYRVVLRRPFFTFDSCAQYLTSPTTPYLLSQAYLSRNQKPPMLIACVRDPTTQTVSWWRYENQAMEWGESMGLSKFNTELRGVSYPPKSILECVRYSESVKPLFVAAEKIGLDSLKAGKEGGKKKILKSLPGWAMTWPGGQLAGVGVSGFFSINILRWERVFKMAFEDNEDEDKDEDEVVLKKTKYVTIMNITDLNSSDLLYDLLIDISERLDIVPKLNTEETKYRLNIELYVNKKLPKASQTVVNGDAKRVRISPPTNVKRNSGRVLSGGMEGLEPSVDEVKGVEKHFEGEKGRMEVLAGRQMAGW